MRHDKGKKKISPPVFLYNERGVRIVAYLFDTLGNEGEMPRKSEVIITPSFIQCWFFLLISWACRRLEDLGAFTALFDGIKEDREEGGSRERRGFIG